MSEGLTRRRIAWLAVLAILAPAAHAADVQSSTDAPEVMRARTAINAKNYQAAISELKVAEARNPGPDVYSLMGFALRKSGDRPQAMVYYNKALAIDPNHKGALEYQGELFVELGQLDKAQQNLNKLDRLCLFGCDEEADLKAAIDQAHKVKS